MIKGLLLPCAQVPVLVTHQRSCFFRTQFLPCLVFQYFFPRTHLCLCLCCCLVNSMTLLPASVDKSCSRIHHKPGVTCLLRLRHLKYSCRDTVQKLLLLFTGLFPITYKYHFCLLGSLPSPPHEMHLPNSWVTQSNSSICSAATFPKRRELDLRTICCNYSNSIPEHDISEDALGNPRWRVRGGSGLQNDHQSVYSLKSYLLPSI